MLPGVGIRAAGVLLLALSAGAFSPNVAASAEIPPPQRVLVVVNDASPLSRTIGEYYLRRRGIPLANVCHIRTPSSEDVARADYDRQIARPIGECLRKGHLLESIYYIVTTAGVPLRIPGTMQPQGDYAAVDSELALLYSDLKTGQPHHLPGHVPNPFFGKKTHAFSHPEFPMYLVTRLAAYDFAGVKAMIDRSLEADRPGSNRGKFVLDLRGPRDETGNDWLRNAAIFLPRERVVLDESLEPVYNLNNVIGYASWGSNDIQHDRRFPGFHWLPGAIATEYVSTDGRTFARPPDSWQVSRNWTDRSKWFAGAPQSLAADYLQEGATGASGHVAEPYLGMTPRPDLLFPAYYSGRNLAESFYLAIPGLSWQNIVLGDPLCALGKPE